MLRSAASLILTTILLAGSAEAQWVACGRDLSRETYLQYSPRAASNGSGGAIVVWEDSRNVADPLAYPDIYARVITATGSPLGAIGGTPICTQPREQSNPAIASDGAGGAIIVWVDYRNQGDGTSFSDIYAQRVNSSGDPLWAIDGRAVCTAPDYQSSPEVIGDGAGGAIIAWTDSRNGTDNNDIYAQRLNASGTPLWTANGVALCTAPRDQNLPQLTSDGAGGAIATWNDARGNNVGTGNDIYARRINSSGTPLWAADGVSICSTTGDQNYPQLVGDGSGGAYIAWVDRRQGRSDVYAQRVDAAGASLWTTHGKLYAVNGGRPQIVSTGSADAIFAWPSGGGLFAQRVDGTGFPYWTSGGVQLSALSVIAMEMIADGLGGAIVTWHTVGSEGTGYDVFAQSVSASGSPGPSSNGITVCNASANQYYPTLARTGTGAAIVAYNDERDNAATGTDIYAAYAAPGGIPAAVEATQEPAGQEAPRSPTLTRPYPSPTVGGATFRVGLPEPGFASLRIYDASGRAVANVMRGTHPAGWLVRSWNGLDDSGRKVRSGVYFAALEANGDLVHRKVVVAR